MFDLVGTFKGRRAVDVRQKASSESNTPEKTGGVPNSDPLARDSLGTARCDCIRSFSAERLKRYPGATGARSQYAGVFGRRAANRTNEY